MGLVIYKDFVEIDKKTLSILTNNGFLHNIRLTSNDGLTYVIGNSIVHIYKTEELVDKTKSITQHIYAINPVTQYDCHVTFDDETKVIKSVATNFKQGENDLIVDSIEVYLKLKVFKMGEPWRDRKYEN